MPKKLDEETERIHLVISKRDIERIDKIFSGSRSPGGLHMKRSEAIRTILRKFLDQVEARAQQNFSSIKVDDI